MHIKIIRKLQSKWAPCTSHHLPAWLQLWVSHPMMESWECLEDKEPESNCKAERIRITGARLDWTEWGSSLHPHEVQNFKMMRKSCLISAALILAPGGAQAYRFWWLKVDNFWDKLKGITLLSTDNLVKELKGLTSCISSGFAAELNYKTSRTSRVCWLTQPGNSSRTFWGCKLHLFLLPLHTQQALSTPCCTSF